MHISYKLYAETGNDHISWSEMSGVSKECGEVMRKISVMGKRESGTYAGKATRMKCGIGKGRVCEKSHHVASDTWDISAGHEISDGGCPARAINGVDIGPGRFGFLDVSLAAFCSSADFVLVGDHQHSLTSIQCAHDSCVTKHTTVNRKGKGAYGCTNQASCM